MPRKKKEKAYLTILDPAPDNPKFGFFTIWPGTGPTGHIFDFEKNFGMKNHSMFIVIDLTKIVEDAQSISEPEPFLKSKIADLASLTPRTVHFYTDEGLVIPEVQSSEGKGKRRKYSKANLAEFLLIKQLVKISLPLSIVSKIMEFMRETRKKGQKWWEM